MNIAPSWAQATSSVVVCSSSVKSKKKSGDGNVHKVTMLVLLLLAIEISSACAGGVRRGTVRHLD